MRYFVQCWSSWVYYFESLSQIETRVEIASEYRYKVPILHKNMLVITLSQFGETADTLAVVEEFKKKKIPVIGLCNVEGSTLCREADATILLHAGPEIAVASTKTFTSQIVILYLLAIFMAKLKNMQSLDIPNMVIELETIPDKIGLILDEHRKIDILAQKYASFHDFYFLGRGVLYPLALEGALKLKEIAYVNAVGYAAGEMKHGPIALLDEKVPTIVLCANESLETKIISNLMESKARRAPIIVAGFKNLEKDFFQSVQMNTSFLTLMTIWLLYL
ncbi:MAG: SIS domain-containing protein [Chlamydiae bacterium]|nr:SIS domain-containing protein [Chlamydiota bacterium]